MNCIGMFRSIGTETLGIVGVLGALGMYVLLGPKVRYHRKNGLVPGLQNLGNTCFLNAVLQALAPCSSIVQWCKNTLDARASSYKKTSLMFNLHKTLQVLNNAESLNEETYNPSLVIGALKANHWVISHEQQDAHELLQVLTETLQEEVDNVQHESHRFLSALQTLMRDPLKSSGIYNRGGDYWPPRHDSQVISRAPFQGSMVTEMSCQDCQYKFPQRFDSFDTLTLTLPSVPTMGVSLDRLLCELTRPELISSGSCERCKDSTRQCQTIVRRQRLCRLPRLLTMHIQRTTWTPTGTTIKRHEHVRFSEILDVTPYTSRRAEQTENLACSRLPRASGEPLPLRGGAADCASSAVSSCAQYRLCSVISHMGSADIGHFVTFRRCPPQISNVARTRWVYASDDNIGICSLADVVCADAYMLFYEKLT